MQILLAVALASGVSAPEPVPGETPSRAGLVHLALGAGDSHGDRPFPLLAAGLTALAPLSYYLVYQLAPGSPEALGFKNLGGLAAGALTLASGYIYAGDPGRGLGVVAGGFGLVALGLGGTFALMRTASDTGDALFIMLLGMLATAVTLTGYYGWAIYDAYATADHAP